MRTLTIAAALLAASVSTASASCGGTWSFGIDYDQERTRDSNSTFSTYDRNSFDRENTDEYGIGIQFKMPLSDHDCKKREAETAKLRAERRYAEQKAEREQEQAISKRIDNLQRLIVTCKTEDLPVCSQIDEMSLELFN